MSTESNAPRKPASSGTAAMVPNPVRRGPVLLAIHGGEATSVAILAANALAGRIGVELKVVTVVEVQHEYGAPDLLPIPRAEPANGDAQADTVRRLMLEILGPEAKWTLDARAGSPAREIASAARDAGATLVVVDAAPRRGMRRVVGGVRALQIVGRSPCPVVSVPTTWTGLPAVVVAPMDFSPASIRAAQAALLVAGENARVILVHVPLPVHFRHAVRDKAGSVVGGDVDALFSRALEQLESFASPGMTFETRLEEGSVVSAVLSVAEAEHADLIAVGTHGPGPVERFFVGSVAAGLLHSATCPVLVSPPPGLAEFMRIELDMTGDASTDNPEAWGEVLAAASDRNMGRRVDIEVDDPSIGAQVQAAGYFLRGIDYDRADRSVEIMMDEGPGGAAHLSRSIAHVRSIAIAATPAGRDRSIEIVHGRGHTLINFRE